MLKITFLSLGLFMGGSSGRDFTQDNSVNQVDDVTAMEDTFVNIYVLLTLWLKTFLKLYSMYFGEHGLGDCLLYSIQLNLLNIGVNTKSTFICHRKI